MRNTTRHFASSSAIAGACLLLCVFSKQDSTAKAADTSPAPASQGAPTAAATLPVLNEATVLEAMNRSAGDSLPIFLRISKATFTVVNAVDSYRTIKGEVTFELLEDTFKPSSDLTFTTNSTQFTIHLLKVVKKKGDTIVLPFDARLDITRTPLNISMPQLEDYGREMAKFRHYYVEGGEVATKAKALIDAAVDATSKAKLVEQRWSALKQVKDSLIDAEHFQADLNEIGFTGEIPFAVAFDDKEFTNDWYKQVRDRQFNSWAEKYGAHKTFVQASFDETYPKFEKIVNDAKVKADACSEYLLGL